MIVDANSMKQLQESLNRISLPVRQEGLRFKGWPKTQQFPMVWDVVAELDNRNQARQRASEFALRARMVCE